MRIPKFFKKENNLVKTPRISSMIKRPIEELVNLEEPAWPEYEEIIKKSPVNIAMIPVSEEHGRQTLFDLQVTSRSPMGGVALNTGGLVVDNGWLRFLGGGTTLMASLATANNLDKENHLFNAGNIGYILVAYDVAGGHFAVDGGVLGSHGSIFYAGPDNAYQWDNLGFGYGQFLYWAISDPANLQEFYSNIRWKGWESDAIHVSLQQAYSFFPLLSTVEGQDIEKVNRRLVPIQEILSNAFKPAWTE